MSLRGVPSLTSRLWACGGLSGCGWVVRMVCTGQFGKVDLLRRLPSAWEQAHMYGTPNGGSIVECVFVYVRLCVCVIAFLNT
jgi:hypothetical protein